MYEKPQYLTKDGFKRLTKNPCKDKSAPLPLKKTKAQSLKEIQLKIPYKGKGLSENAAKLIAMAFKQMLKEEK